jgi:hypothetical protein
MKLTRRQEEFISNLIDLSDEFDGPIHYSMLADRLGVSPFTAYDMLCLLEEKGCVTSEYQLPDGKRGPGRAERLFTPCKSPAEREKELADEFGGQLPPKEDFKQMVIAVIESGDIKNKDLAQEVLARLPDIEDRQISFCVELLTVAALRMQEDAGRRIWLEYLPVVLNRNPSTRENLALLGGFALGILAQEKVPGDEWIQNFLAYIQRYLSIVNQLDPGDCDQLAEALHIVFQREAQGVH